jgi:hypothetical protein
VSKCHSRQQKALQIPVFQDVINVCGELAASVFRVVQEEQAARIDRIGDWSSRPVGVTAVYSVLGYSWKMKKNEMR